MRSFTELWPTLKRLLAYGSPWRKPLARHDPAKVVLDVAVSLALGGDACRDAALLRGQRWSVAVARRTARRCK